MDKHEFEKLVKDLDKLELKCSIDTQFNDPVKRGEIALNIAKYIKLNREFREKLIEHFNQIKI